MEPCSILELSSTVLKLSLKLYRFFKALHDAPEEVHEYLSVLESIRRVFQDVKDYAVAHLHSAFFEHDGMRLTVVEAALQDCELEFTLQLSNVEELDPATASSFFRAMGRQTKRVLRKETLEGLTKKLEKLQGLLSLAVMTSTGRNEVFMREKLQSISFDVGKVHATQEAERKRTAGFTKLAAELHVRSDTRLSDICESLDTEFGTKGESEVRTSKPAASTSSLENFVDDECQNMWLANEHEASALSARQDSGNTSSTLSDRSDEETSYFRSNSVEVDIGVQTTTHQNQVDHFEKIGQALQGSVVEVFSNGVCTEPPKSSTAQCGHTNTFLLKPMTF
ncbi:hypothetical protein MMC22_000488 [Lobaria immixta]|nr:hypothetical protein [Lobaria immixta]